MRHFVSSTMIKQPQEELGHSLMRLDTCKAAGIKEPMIDVMNLIPMGTATNSPLVEMNLER
jgi:hypothetical protein